MGARKKEGSHHSPKLKPGRGTHGNGLFAHKPLKKDEFLVQWTGKILEKEAFFKLPKHVHSLSVQIDEDRFLVADQLVDADYVNHSCDPNAGMSGSAGLVAIRDIQPGEEIGYDYAMTDGSTYDEFPCQCGAKNCRTKVTGNDWKLPELQKRYKGYFSPYLQKRIENLTEKTKKNK